MVSAMGATSALRPVKVPLTMLSVNSTSHSTKFCMPPGVPAVAFLATLLNSHRNNAPSRIDQNMVSTWIAQKPMALASAAVCARPQ
jgi:hypothetical protein